MKVAIVHDFLNQLGGAERVLSALHEIYPEAPVYTLLYDAEKTKNQFQDYDITTSYLQNWPKFLRKRQKYLLPFMPAAIESFDFSQYDLVISSSNSFAKGVITGPNTTHFCYCHSPMRYGWDWYFEYLKENRLGWLSRKIVKILLHKIRLWDSASAKRVDYWIANSKNVAKRIEKYYRRQAEVIYPPVNISKHQISEKPDDYFLVVSRLSAYKKIDLAVEAANELEVLLVVVGVGEQYNMLSSIAGPTVKLVGYKSDEKVAEYFSKCRAFINPQEEDFGITEIEAMASGRPVIAYQKGGALEVIKEGDNGLFFAEPTVESLKTALQKFEKHEKAFNPQKIRQSVEKFSLEKFKKNITGFINSKI